MARSQEDTGPTRPPPATATRHCCCQTVPGFTAKMSPLGTSHTGRFSVLSPCHEPKHPVLIPHTLPHCRRTNHASTTVHARGTGQGCTRVAARLSVLCTSQACVARARPRHASCGSSTWTETLQTPSVGTRAPQRLLACRSCDAQPQLRH